MSENMAVHHKTTGRYGTEEDSEGNRARWNLVNVRLRRNEVVRLRLGAGHDDGVVPFRDRERLAIDMGDQKVGLVDMERMVSERPVGNRPFLVVTDHHVGKQRLVRRKESFLLKA